MLFTRRQALRYYGNNTIIIPLDYDSIEEDAFYEFFYLRKIVIHKGITMIPEACFAFCKNLKIIEWHDDIVSIGEDAFLACERLTNVTLPKNLKFLSDGSFFNSDIRELTIPAGVTKIPLSCFSGNKNLTRVNIHNNLNHLGRYAFTECPRLNKSNLLHIKRENNSFIIEN